MSALEAADYGGHTAVVDTIGKLLDTGLSAGSTPSPLAGLHLAESLLTPYVAGLRASQMDKQRHDATYAGDAKPMLKATRFVPKHFPPVPVCF